MNIHYSSQIILGIYEGMPDFLQKHQNSYINKLFIMLLPSISLIYACKQTIEESRSSFMSNAVCQCLLPTNGDESIISVLSTLQKVTRLVSNNTDYSKYIWIVLTYSHLSIYAVPIFNGTNFQWQISLNLKWK